MQTNSVTYANDSMVCSFTFKFFINRSVRNSVVAMSVESVRNSNRLLKVNVGKSSNIEHLFQRWCWLQCSTSISYVFICLSLNLFFAHGVLHTGSASEWFTPLEAVVGSHELCWGVIVLLLGYF